MSLTRPGTRRVLKNATFFYGSLLINQLTRAIYVVVAARFLGPDLYGLLSYGQAWYLSFMQLALLGVGPIMISAVGRNKDAGALVVDRVMALRLVSIALVSLGSGILGLLIVESRVLSLLTVIFSFALIGRACSTWADQLFLAYEQTGYSFRQHKVFRTGEVLMGVLVVLVTRDVVLVALLHATIWLVQGLSSLVIAHRNLQALKPIWERSEIGPLLWAGLPIGLSLTFGTFTLQGGIVLFRAQGATDELVGNFGILVQAVAILGAAFNALSKAALPAISRSVDRGDSSHRLFLNALIRLAFLVGGLAGIWGIAIGSETVTLVLGQNYVAAAGGLGLMLWVLIPLVIREACASVSIAHFRYGSLLGSSVSGTLALIAGVILLSPVYGIHGVVISTLIGVSVSSAVMLLEMIRRGLVDHVTDIPKLLIAMTASLATVLALASSGGVIAAVVASVVLVGGVFTLGVVRPAERAASMNFVRGRLKRLLTRS